jgi:hypothetical protein
LGNLKNIYKAVLRKGRGRTRAKKSLGKEGS